MPSTFQTCLLVTALAGYSNAQVYFALNLANEPVKNDALLDARDEQLEHEGHPRLDHAYDGAPERYADHDDFEAQRAQTHFKEVHHPHEDFDFGSAEDVHRHYSPEDDKYYPREAAESYQRHYPMEHRYGLWSNEVPMNGATKPEENGKFDNVLEDEDPAICFVKAYARKPLGAPTKHMANSIPLDDYWQDTYQGYRSNALDYWYDDYENDFDDDEYDDYDNYGLYDDYSDSEGDYYGDEDDEYSDEYGSSQEEETSSEEDSEGHFDLGFDDDDLWGKKHGHYNKHAQFFDLANQEGPASTATPAAADTDSESEPESSETDGEDSSENEANYGRYGRQRRRHRRRAAGGQGQGRGHGGRRSRRHQTGRRQHDQQPAAEDHQGQHQRQRRRHRRQGQQAHELPAHFPAASSPAQGQHRSPHVTEPMQQPQQFQQSPQHDRHGPPASARRQRRQRKQQDQQHQQQPAKKQGGRKQRKQRRRHTLANDEDEPVDEDFTCPKFFEKHEEGCEKPLSLWRGNGQKKKCSNCQKCEQKWFPQCPPSFVVTECDVCAPVCPDGMIDHEGTCMKAGVEVVTTCGHDEQMIDGECYRQCPGQTSEFDVLCFGLCPMDMYKCGHTLCLKADQQCPQYVADKAINLDKLVEKYKKNDHFGSRLIDLSHQSMFPFPECH